MDINLIENNNINLIENDNIHEWISDNIELLINYKMNTIYSFPLENIINIYYQQKYYRYIIYTFIILGIYLCSFFFIIKNTKYFS